MKDVPASAAGCLLCFDDELPIARAVADQAALRCAVMERHRFPDGELRLRLPEAQPARVVLWRGLHQPNEKLVELLIAARTARELGASERAARFGALLVILNPVTWFEIQMPLFPWR